MVHPIKIRNQKFNKAATQGEKNALYWLVLKEQGDVKNPLIRCIWVLDVPKRNPPFIVACAIGNEISGSNEKMVYFDGLRQNLSLPDIGYSLKNFTTKTMKALDQTSYEYSEAKDAIECLSSALTEAYAPHSKETRPATVQLENGADVKNWHIEAGRIPVVVLTKWVKFFKIETLLQIQSQVADGVTLLGSDDKGILEILRAELFEKETTNDTTAAPSG